MKISATAILLVLFSVLSSTSALICEEILTNVESACNNADGGDQCKWTGKSPKQCGDHATCENNSKKNICKSFKKCKWHNSAVESERGCTTRPVAPACSTLTEPTECKKYKKRTCKWMKDQAVCEDKPKKTSCSEYEKSNTCKKSKDVGPHCTWDVNDEECVFKSCVDSKRYGKKKKCLNNPTCKWVPPVSGVKGEGQCQLNTV